MWQTALVRLRLHKLNVINEYCLKNLLFVLYELQCPEALEAFMQNTLSRLLIRLEVIR